MRKLAIEELQRLDIDEFKSSTKIPLAVVLDNVRSLNNIGSVFRTSDAFRVEKIFLCGITACPPHKDIHKTALGATESVDWEYYEDSLELCKKLIREGYRLLPVEQVENSTDLDSLGELSSGKYALVFGHEIRGVQQEIIDLAGVCIEIPQWGTKHSLNVSVSAGIVIWELFKKLKQNL